MTGSTICINLTHHHEVFIDDKTIILMANKWPYSGKFGKAKVIQKYVQNAIHNNIILSKNSGKRSF